MEQSKLNEQKDEQQEYTYLPANITSPYAHFFPNFKSSCMPSRTESRNSDLIIDSNGARKTKFFGIRLYNWYY